jgi:hypothetical protein
MAAIISQFVLGFPADEVNLMVNWGDDRWYQGANRQFEYAKWLGFVQCRFKNNGITDSSGLEEGEGSRYIRKTFSGELSEEGGPSSKSQRTAVISPSSAWLAS